MKKLIVVLFMLLFVGCTTAPVRPPYYYKGRLVSCGNPNCLKNEQQMSYMLNALTAIEMYPEQGWEVARKALKDYYNWSEHMQRWAPEVGE